MSYLSTTVGRRNQAADLVVGQVGNCGRLAIGLPPATDNIPPPMVNRLQLCRFVGQVTNVTNPRPMVKILPRDSHSQSLLQAAFQAALLAWLASALNPRADTRPYLTASFLPAFRLSKFRIALNTRK